MSKESKKEISVFLVVNGILVLMNYQTNHFEFVWFIYPLLIWGSIIVINRIFR